MSKQANKRLRKHLKLEVNRDKLPAYAWPGGYPLFYIFTDGGVICPKCLNENIVEIDEANREKGQHFNSHGGWAVEGVDCNWEDDDLHCDHCHQQIEPAYPKD